MEEKLQVRFKEGKGVGGVYCLFYTDQSFSKGVQQGIDVYMYKRKEENKVA